MIKKIFIMTFLIISLVGCGGGSTKQDNLKISGEYLTAYNNYLDREDKGFENTKSIILNNKNIDLISENDKEIIFSINGIEFHHINTDIPNSLPSTPLLFSEVKMKANIVAAKNTVSSKKQTALVMQPFFDKPSKTGNFYGSGDDVAKFIHKLADNHFKVTYLKDTEVTLEVLKTIGNYDFVYMLTHGGEDGLLVSGEKGLIQDHEKYPHLENANEGQLGVKPSFWLQIPGIFKTKVFVANACNSSFTNTLSNTLFQKGVDVFIGWNDFTTNTVVQIGDIYLNDLYSQCAPLRTLTEPLKQALIERQKPINCSPSQRDCHSLTGLSASDIFQIHDIRRSSSTFGEDIYLNSSCLVADTTLPVISLNGSALVYSDLNKEYVDEGATAKDDRDGDIEVNIDTTKVNTAKLGIYSVIITAEDKAGNKATKIRKVQIVKGEVPVKTGTTTVTLGGGSFKNFPVPIDHYDKGDYAYVTPSYAINSVGDTYFTTYVFKLNDKVGSNNLSLRIRFRASSDEGGIGPLQTSFQIYELDENKDQTTYVPPRIDNSTVSLRFRGNSSFGPDFFPYFNAFANVSEGINDSVIDMSEWLEAEILIKDGIVYSKYDDVIYKTINYNVNEDHSMNIITLTFQGSAYVDYVRLFKEDELIFEEDF